MTVDEFLAWAEGAAGPLRVVPRRGFRDVAGAVGHTEVKGQCLLPRCAPAIRQRGLPCHALTDGPTVRIDESTAYEPDALVYCGGKDCPPTALEVPNPVHHRRGAVAVDAAGST